MLDNYYFIFYTSGSTGKLKKIYKTFDALCKEAKSISLGLRLNKEDRILCVAPNFHSYGQGYGFFAPAAARSKVKYLSFTTISTHIIKELSKSNYSVLISTPSYYNSICNELKSFNDLKLKICSGGPLTKKIIDSGLVINNAYGSTETGAISIHLSESPITINNVGKEYPGVEISTIYDSFFNSYRFLLKSPYIASFVGKTKIENDGGLYLLSDYGYRSKYDEITIVDRVDDIVNINGEIVSLKDVENKILNLPYIKLAAVISKVDNNFVNYLEAFVTLRSNVDEWKIRKDLLVSEQIESFKFGASGARPCITQPGGEVLEYCLINGLDGSGISQSVSGYLPSNENGYSRSIGLHDKDCLTLREERAVYSHTAWLKECDKKESTSLYLEIRARKGKQNLLNILDDILDNLNINSCAIQLYVQNKSEHIEAATIKGRVLKHIPEKPFTILQEATDIAVEHEYPLVGKAFFYGFGTKYDRYEPEWEKFTKGKKYESRGHIHASIVNNDLNSNLIHETFHLRELFFSSDACIDAIITPISDIYRIYPIFKNGEEYYCSASRKNIKQLINEIDK